jgi:2Fe-2S ferredoxin
LVLDFGSRFDFGERGVEAGRESQEEQGRMGGQNPYIEETKFVPATKKYKVTFVKNGEPVEVDPAKIPYGHDGLPGSILDISQGFHKGVTPKSRLGCQLVPDGTKDIVVEIPDWNKNYAKEAEH